MQNEYRKIKINCENLQFIHGQCLLVNLFYHYEDIYKKPLFLCHAFIVC